MDVPRYGDLLVVVSAPLHGEGLPRKVLRLLDERPLLAHALEIGRGVVQSDRQVIVLTDDDEVAMRAEREGYKAVVDERSASGPTRVAAAISTLLVKGEAGRGAPFETVLLLEPSSPLLKPLDLATAVQTLASGEFDSVISASKEIHRTWMLVDGHYVPDFGQWPQATKENLYRETGGFIVSRRAAILADRFLGPRVGVAAVPPERAISITTPHEWWICERLLRRKRIVFVVAGNRLVGMGHIYRTLQLAHEINNHELLFICTRESDLAAQVFTANRYTTLVQDTESLVDCVLAQSPDLVINDFLDTDVAYVRALKASGAKVINFEDLGGGAQCADLVFNEVYGDPAPKPNHRVGPDYFCIRDEFLSAPERPFSDAAQEVLITFGGVDEENLTSRILSLIWPEANRRGIRLSVVTGAGYGHAAELKTLIDNIGSPLVLQTNRTKRMSEYMARADLAFSSAGRTLFELATMRVPAIVMACNPREETHPFASSHSGFAYLGRHDRVSDAELLSTFRQLVNEPRRRRAMRECLERFSFRDGKKRVLTEIADVAGVALN